METRIQLDVNMVVALLKERFGEGLKGFGFDLSEDAPMIELDVAHNDAGDWPPGLTKTKDVKIAQKALELPNIDSLLFAQFLSASTIETRSCECPKAGQEKRESNSFCRTTRFVIFVAAHALPPPLTMFRPAPASPTVLPQTDLSPPLATTAIKERTSRIRFSGYTP